MACSKNGYWVVRPNLDPDPDPDPVPSGVATHSCLALALAQILALILALTLPDPDPDPDPDLRRFVGTTTRSLLSHRIAATPSALTIPGLPSMPRRGL